jgi:hypothetical protein
MAGTTVLLQLPAASRHVVGSFNATLISLAVIAAFVRVVRRRSQLSVAVVIAVPALIAIVAALGLALPRRRGATDS